MSDVLEEGEAIQEKTSSNPGHLQSLEMAGIRYQNGPKTRNDSPRSAASDTKGQKTIINILQKKIIYITDEETTH